jgi:hypothetical protein
MAAAASKTSTNLLWPSQAFNDLLAWQKRKAPLHPLAVAGILAAVRKALRYLRGIGSARKVLNRWQSTRH